jgi:hypothetical protein
LRILVNKGNEGLEPVKTLIKKIVPVRLLDLYRKVRDVHVTNKKKHSRIADWKNNGCLVPPPPLIKQEIIKKYAKKYRMRVFVETGTYMGNTIEACKDTFDRIISIELNRNLHEMAKEKFLSNNHITLYQGDSSDVLPAILADISEPTLFWLDGHYSEGITSRGKISTPIMAELQHVFSHTNDKHVILIDDARCFTGDDDYPTIDTLIQFVIEKKPLYDFFVQHDIIFIAKEIKRLGI